MYCYAKAWLSPVLYQLIDGEIEHGQKKREEWRVGRRERRELEKMEGLNGDGSKAKIE